LATERTFLEPDDKFLGGHRTREVVALDLVAAHPTEALDGGAILNPFGYHLEPEVMGEFDGGADDHGVAVVPVVPEVPDEASVDLEFADRELA
jgi:hypothetical protein